MAVKTKHTFPNAVGTNGQSATVFAGHGIELNNLDDLDVYVTLSGGTRVLQNRNALTNETAQSPAHPQVSNTDGLYFPAVSAGTTLYNYQLTTANDTITFNSALPTGAVVTVERRTRDASSAYTTFAGGSTIRHTDLNRSATESNYTAQEGRNKAFELEGKIFGDAAKDSSFITSADIVDGTIVAADLATDSVTTDKIQDDAVTGDKLNNTGVSAGSYTVSAITVDAQGRLTAASNGTIGADNIAGDAINGDKIADDSINSEHYVDGSIDTAHIGNAQVTLQKMASSAVSSDVIINGAVTTPKLAADAVNGDKIADNSINSEHYVDGSIDTIHIGDNQINTAKLADNAVETANILDNNVTMAKLGSGALPTDITVNADNLVGSSVGTSEIATDAVNGSKIADNSIDSEHYVDGSIDTQHIANAQITVHKMANDAVSTGVLRDDAVTTAKIAADAVTTSEIADAELKTLAGMQSGTASNLASSTALTSTNAELNLLDGKSIVTTISGSSTDVQLPTAKAVNDAVTGLNLDNGNYVPINNEVSFPNSNPDPGDDAGTIVSIADAGGIVVNGSGVSTTGRTLGGATVTINGIDSTLYNTTIAAGKGMLVQTTSTLNTYDYHRLVVDEAGVAAAQTLVSDFNQRYRVGASNPSSSLDDGDLFFNTSSNKMLVYNETDTAWEEVQSVGNYFINTISSLGASGDTIPGGSATPNGVAKKFTLSNAGTYAEQHIVSINGVIQKPNSGTSVPTEGFAIDGSTIIFSDAPPTGSDYFIITVGASVNIGTPSNNTVSTAIIQNLAVTGDKIATNLDLADNKKIRFGTGNDLQIYHDSNNTLLRNYTGNLYIRNESSGTSVTYLQIGNNESAITYTGNGSVELYYDNSKKFETDSNGVNITGQLDLTSNLSILDNSIITIGSGDDLQIKHDGTDSYIQNDTGHLIIDSDSLSLRSKTGGEAYLTATVNGATKLRFDNSTKLETTAGGVTVTGNCSVDGLYLSDNDRVYFGDGNDLEIYHSGTTNWIVAKSHNLHIDTASGNENAIKIIQNGAVELYYDGVKKLSTDAHGVQIHDWRLQLNAAAEGEAAEMYFYADQGDDSGDCWRLSASDGDSSGGVFRLQGYPTSGLETFWGAHNNGAVDLYYDGVKKFETTNGGTKVTGQLYTTDYIYIDNGADLWLEDNGKIQIGNGSDIQIYHNGTDSYIDNSTGDFLIRSSGDMFFYNSWNNEYFAKFIPNAAVELYWDGSKKLETTSSGITVTGSVTTQDINMSNLNAPTPNEVDGTRGNWTMQEGADDLFLINRSNGKKYKFNLTEVS